MRVRHVLFLHVHLSAPSPLDAWPSGGRAQGPPTFEHQAANGSGLGRRDGDNWRLEKGRGSGRDNLNLFCFWYHQRIRDPASSR